jgi:SH3-like domain-containing protein
MSKAEEMKIEIKERKQATDKMTAIVFAEIQKHLKKCHNKMSITIQTGPSGRHRYLRSSVIQTRLKLTFLTMAT